jgi:hypothetical protein
MRKQLALVAVLLFGLACGGNSVVRRRHRPSLIGQSAKPARTQ